MTKVAFKTILSSTEGLYKEKGSKFLSKAYPIESEIQAKEILADLKKEFYDARHICYAMSLQGQILLERANDDGEPAHTAGTPILNQIKSFEVSNILVVVVRYFGGTKLGVSGLIQAYKTAAEEALKVATFYKVEPKERYKFVFAYEHTGQVMHWLKELNGAIISEIKTAHYELIAETPIDCEEALREKWEACKHLVQMERIS